MSQNDGLDFTDPLGVWRSFRDTNLEALAKGMSSMVNTEAFSKAIGMQLDSYLVASAPFQKAVEQYMAAYLAQLHMPSRVEVISLAERMINIEMRLDDMDARLDDILAAVQTTVPAAPVAAPAAPSIDGERLAALERRTEQVLELLQRMAEAPASPAAAAPASEPPAPRRARPSAKNEEA
jgi:hypothetical protein